MKRIARWVVISLILIVVAGWGSKRVLTNYLREHIESAVHNSCPTCTLKIGWLHLNVLSLGLTAGDIHFKSGTHGAFETASAIARVRLKIALRPLFSNSIEIQSLDVDHPVVTLTDGDGHSPAAAESSEEESEYTFAIRETTINDGVLNYIRNHEGTHAVLAIHDIQASLDAMGTTPELRLASTQAVGDGRIEKSGRVVVRVTSPIWQRPLHIDTAVFVRNQNLADLTPFFKENAGVELHGRMFSGRGLAEVRGSHLRARVESVYKDLDIHIDKSYDRTQAAALFMNLGLGVVTKPDNVGKPHFEQVREAELERNPKDSIVSFILEGFKQAAIKVSEARGRP